MGKELLFYDKMYFTFSLMFTISERTFNSIIGAYTEQGAFNYLCVLSHLRYAFEKEAIQPEK